MNSLRKLGSPEVSTSSMADIAFLLLSFFLMTTVIKSDKGLTMLLPQWNLEPIPLQLNQRNIFSIQINSGNQYLIEGEIRTNLDGVAEEIRNFILNPNHSPQLSEHPENAVVSIKTDRGTQQRSFIEALDQAQAAYYSIYAQRAGISPREFRELDLSIAQNRKIYEAARQGIPMNISVAEPTRTGN